MNKNISLIIVIMALVTLIYSFATNQSSASIFGFEISVWVDRLIWAVIGAGSLYEYIKKSRKTSKK